MTLDWVYRFGWGAGLYAGFPSNLVLHLSEHSGDCKPGPKIFVKTDLFAPLYNEITSRSYKYNRPEISTAPWGNRIFEVIDPFSNKILFNEELNL